jgi:GNAT superfamily N-acetyltransferase
MQPVAMLLQVDGTAVASLFVLTKEIRHAGAPYRASGLRAVVTDPGHRGKGYGLRLVRAAHDLVRDRGDDLMLFTCDPELVPFYEAAGSRVLPGTVVLGGTPEQPVRSDDFGKVTLAALFSEQARSAAASFEQSEIALHPGARETLW